MGTGAFGWGGAGRGATLVIELRMSIVMWTGSGGQFEDKYGVQSMALNMLAFWRGRNV